MRFREITGGLSFLKNVATLSNLATRQQMLGVERQEYLGGCIVGNHCDKLLKEGNIDILCSLTPMIIQTNLPSRPELYQNAIIQCEKFWYFI